MSSEITDRPPLVGAACALRACDGGDPDACLEPGCECECHQKPKRAPWGSYGYGRRIRGLYGLKGRITLDPPAEGLADGAKRQEEK